MSSWLMLNSRSHGMSHYVAGLPCCATPEAKQRIAEMSNNIEAIYPTVDAYLNDVVESICRTIERSATIENSSVIDSQLPLVNE